MSHGGDDEVHEEHEEHVNHEAWVIPYADLLTLLMAMFIALFAISNVNDAKFKALARGFSTALGGGKLDAGIGGDGKATDVGDGNGQGNGPFTGGTLTPTNSALNAKELARVLGMISNNSVSKAQQQTTLSQVEEAIKAAAAKQGFGGDLGLKLENRGLVVTLVTDQVLFSPGQATLRPDGNALLDIVGDSLKAIDNPIEIDGYTDSDPIHTAAFPSNDELSAARAIAVEKYFETLGLVEERLTPSGLGERDPVAPNTTAANKARNRRVEIIIQSKVVSETLQQAGLDDKVAVPPKQGSLNPNLSKPVGKPVDGSTPGVNPNLGAS
jgi:chemotaxis protein MotB